MEDIDLTRYNFNYEIQYVQFMVELLKPYIEFQSFDTDEKKNNLAGESVPKKALRIFLKKENGIQESIDENGFIQFIQVDFSNIRHDMKVMYIDELKKEQKYKTEFDTITRGHLGRRGRSKPHNMSTAEYDKKLKYYGYNIERVSINHTEPLSQMSSYELKTRTLKLNVEKLEQIGKICFQKTKTIKDVLLFLNNVKDHYNFNQ